MAKTTLTAEQPALPLAPEVSLGMMWQLALDAWASAGRPLPVYTRADTPVRRLRGADGFDEPV